MKQENEMRKTRLIPFQNDFERKWSTNEVWKWVHGVFGKEIVVEEDEQSQKFEGKTEQDLKTAPIFAKHTFFTIEMSRQQVASLSRQNSQRQKFEKFF